jgi:hypothetical protein
MGQARSFAKALHDGKLSLRPPLSNGGALKGAGRLREVRIGLLVDRCTMKFLSWWKA